jgi:predicted lipoprotein with Yx(FWY)xxD motif
MTRTPLIPLSAALLVPLALAGCGSSGGAYGGGSSTASAPAPATSVTSARAPALAVRKTSIGRALVDAKGRTLYMFGADSKNTSNCSGACASNWPPAAAPKTIKVGPGVAQRKLRAIKRSDGGRQLSYAGHPLYRYAGDAKPGQVNGQGLNAFGGVWNAVAPSGKAITGAAQQAAPAPAPSSPPSTDTTPSYGGY